ncbi:DUF72 domain-containing protein [Thermosipho atlanticus]|uniref:Uncharacterized conserved protein YecE, DUF72 family n=1 Tax=Thermosipho atlanticus DSM 15807 TaxID=1123380 RepID=A0A1M5TNL1_9BACT|nr:DUF72 domain-containing protein [Thermosipho atlanticus]SHH51963.1 Uncharacterized conserved protein YecE, DUF72 family [Thermosipho atlanticus DSM 15807]
MIFVGTSGYQFDDWIGEVYPENIKSKELLNYYWMHYGFNTVELNFTYYTLPSYRSIVTILRKLPHNFYISVKLYGKITHEKNLEYLDKFLENTKILMEENRLIGYLAQFPFSFMKTKENILFVNLIAEKVPRLFVEFRHASWISFDSEKFEIVTIDQPKLPNFYPFIIKAKKFLYVRLHGRNKNWFKHDVKTRYNYNYSTNEMIKIWETIKKFRGDKAIYFNNCFKGKALKNALLFRKLVGGEKIDIFQ